MNQLDYNEDISNISLRFKGNQVFNFNASNNHDLICSLCFPNMLTRKSKFHSQKYLFDILSTDYLEKTCENVLLLKVQEPKSIILTSQQSGKIHQIINMREYFFQRY